VLNVCQPGKDLKCAGYCLYSSSTISVLSIGQGVYGFTLDPLIGEFVLTHRCVGVSYPGLRLAATNCGDARSVFGRLVR
jgi:fructose-1,6-bisphosphatase I